MKLEVGEVIILIKRYGLKEKYAWYSNFDCDNRGYFWLKKKTRDHLHRNKGYKCGRNGREYCYACDIYTKALSNGWDSSIRISNKRALIL